MSRGLGRLQRWLWLIIHMDPLLIAIASKTPEEEHAWLDALAADPGAAEEVLARRERLERW